MFGTINKNVQYKNSYLFLYCEGYNSFFYLNVIIYFLF